MYYLLYHIYMYMYTFVLYIIIYKYKYIYTHMLHICKQLFYIIKLMLYIFGFIFNILILYNITLLKITK